MKLFKFLFPRSGGTWLFWWTFIYFWVGMYATFINPFWSVDYIQAVWLLVCSLPLWIPPLARWLNMKLFWEL